MLSWWLRLFDRRHIPGIFEEWKMTAEQDAGFLSELWFAWLSQLMAARLYIPCPSNISSHASYEYGRDWVLLTPSSGYLAKDRYPQHTWIQNVSVRDNITILVGGGYSSGELIPMLYTPALYCWT